MNTFKDDIYEGIMDRDETWIVYDSGCAMIINDCSLLDC